MSEIDMFLRLIRRSERDCERRPSSYNKGYLLGVLHALERVDSADLRTHVLLAKQKLFEDDGVQEESADDSA